MLARPHTGETCTTEQLAEYICDRAYMCPYAWLCAAQPVAPEALCFQAMHEETNQ